MAIVAQLVTVLMERTTSYGEKPRQDALIPDKFAFFVYFNAFSQKYDVEQNAKTQAKEFAAKNGYRKFDVVNVECDSYMQRKCIYQIKFNK